MIADKVDEAERIHLSRSEVSQLPKLLGVLLGARDDQAQTAFYAIGWRVDHGANEFTDQSLCRLVTRHQIR